MNKNVSAPVTSSCLHACVVLIYSLQILSYHVHYLLLVDHQYCI